MNQVKTAFKIMGGNEWQAGVSYMKALLHALRQNYSGSVNPFILTANTKDDVPVALMGQQVEILKIDESRGWISSWKMKRTLKHHQIDLVFGLLLQRRYGRVPTLSWIPDFQHIHLPEMFSDLECRKRNKKFLKTSEICSYVILMSETVKKDFEFFAPKYSDKARVLRSVSYIPESIYDVDPRSVIQLYNLPEKFIYLPNQFWKHKNHETAFRALKLMKDRGSVAFVVCSGYPVDYRHPNYFSDLLQKVSCWGIRDQIAFLGLIHKEHVLSLMRQAICVLNPSLFEGFGLSVDEARSIGKRVLVSDIPAHREQDPPKAIFFDPYSYEDIAERLTAIWRATPPGPDVKLERDARESLRNRLRAFADSFVSIVREVSGQ